MPMLFRNADVGCAMDGVGSLLAVARTILVEDLLVEVCVPSSTSFLEGCRGDIGEAGRFRPVPLFQSLLVMVTHHRPRG